MVAGRALLFALALGAASGAGAGLFDDDEARRQIVDLGKQVELNRLASDEQLARQGEALRRSLLDLQAEIEALRAELARMRGSNEQLTRDIGELRSTQKAQVQLTEERLSRVESQKISHDGREFNVEPQEKADFEAALGVFRKGDYAGAARAFTDFTRRHPASGYGPSALFWLGNAQYATRDYTGAIGSFRGLLSGAPEHLRAPESMLAIANCQVELKDIRAARKTLEDLLKTYPQTEAAPTARERLARLK